MKKLCALFLCLVFVFALIPAGVAFASDGPDASDPIVIGGIYDMTGEYSLNGIEKYYAAEYAVSEINEKGGVLGRELQLLAYDGQSDNARYQELAQKLVFEDEVAAVFACQTSSSREAIRPLMEENKMIFFYDNQYEGGVASKYTFCTGAYPEHQIVPSVEKMIETFGPNYYCIAADYNFGWGSVKWVDYVAGQHGGNNVGTEFVPTDVSQFSASIEKIEAAKPDWVFNCLTGISQTSYFSQWAAADLGIPEMSTVLVAQSYEHLRFDPPALENMYVCAPYIPEVDTPEAKAFAEGVKEMFPDSKYVQMDAGAEYLAINLWAAAVEQAGTEETEAVLAALESGITLEGMPQGTVTLDPATHSCIMDCWLFHCDENHNIVFDSKAEQVRAYWLSDVMGVDLTKDAPNKQFEIDDMEQ